jgi:hypothetical protein
MAIHLTLAVVLAAGTAGKAELCAGMVRDTEPEMQIHESDLDRASAAEAIEWLRVNVDLGTLDGERQSGAMNKLKILQGHVFLQQVLADRRNFGPDSDYAIGSKASFCTWLAKEGFWYD